MTEVLLAGALLRIAIGKMLLAGGAMAELLVRTAGESSWLGALRQRAIGKMLLAGAPWQRNWRRHGV